MHSGVCREEVGQRPLDPASVSASTGYPSEARESSQSSGRSAPSAPGEGGISRPSMAE
jgi:hypothetical protein